MAAKLVDAILTKRSHVLIATFSPWKNGARLPINGNLEPLRDYFVPKVERVMLIDQVYPGSDFVIPRIELYESGKLAKITSAHQLLYSIYPLLFLTNRPGTQFFFKIRDFLSVLIEGVRAPQPFDLCIGFEAINALAGILLRKLGRVRRVVYYVSDYSPNRYQNRWFNALYLWLDRQAAIASDIIWDVSPAIQPARIQLGLDPNKSAPVVRVPNALYPAQIRQLPVRKIEPYSLVFMGTLGEENGPGLAIEALSHIVKTFPCARLHIIGGPEHEIARLKKLVAGRSLVSRVFFYGFIANRVKAAAMLRRFSIALAPYRAIPGSVRWYGDATKIRAYLAAGLPTITTHVPPLGKEIASRGAGIVVADTPRAIAEAVCDLFDNRKRFLALRRRAIAFARDNTWERVYTHALAAPIYRSGRVSLKNCRYSRRNS